VDQVAENRQGRGVGLIERQRDRVPDAEAHAQRMRPNDVHDPASHVCIIAYSTMQSIWARRGPVKAIEFGEPPWALAEAGQAQECCGEFGSCPKA
jgi:hypothetical protein